MCFDKIQGGGIQDVLSPKICFLSQYLNLSLTLTCFKTCLPIKTALAPYLWAKHIKSRFIYPTMTTVVTFDQS